MSGISSVFAVDPASAVAVTGTLRDAHGEPLGGIQLLISEEQPPANGLAGSLVVTADDGSFAATIEPWGTADAPATLTIRTPADQQVDVQGEPCSRTWGIAVSDSRQVVLAGSTDPLPPIDLVATRTLVGELCGTTATPPPAAAPAEPVSNVTPPPTDTIRPALGGPSERLAPALLIGFVVGLAAALFFLVPRPGARRD